MPDGIIMLHEKIILSDKSYVILAIIFIAAIFVTIAGRKVMVKCYRKRILGLGIYYTGVAMMIACIFSCSPLDFSALEPYMGNYVKKSGIYEIMITDEADEDSVEELRNKYTILSTNGNVYTVKEKLSENDINKT